MTTAEAEAVVYEEGTVDCGCCNGLAWGGEYPRECRDCKGSGLLYRYPSGALALYRGGPFAGQDSPDFRHRLFEAAS